MKRLGKPRLSIGFPGTQKGLFIGSENTTTPPPPAPVATAATDVDYFDFDASWNASTGATGYYLDVATDSGFTSFVPGFQNLDVGNVTSYFVDTLDSNTTYYYRLRAYNSGGTSANSNAISATTKAFLLDNSTLAHVKAGLSLRILLGAYYKSGSGFLVEIMRASDSATKSFLADPLQNYSLTLNSTDGAGTDLGTWIGSENGFISKIYNQNGIDAIQTTPGAMPQIIASGALILDNALPAISSTSSTYLDVATIFATGNSAKTYICVFSSNVVGAGNVLINENTALSGGTGGYTTLTTEFAIRVNGNAVFSSGANGSQQLLFLTYPGTTIANHVLNIDNVNSPVASSGSGGSPMNVSGTASKVLGYSAAFGFEGKCQEIVIFDDDQSANEVALTNNINNYYLIFP